MFTCDKLVKIQTNLYILIKLSQLILYNGIFLAIVCRLLQVMLDIIYITVSAWFNLKVQYMLLIKLVIKNNWFQSKKSKLLIAICDSLLLFAKLYIENTLMQY